MKTYTSVNHPARLLTSFGSALLAIVFLALMSTAAVAQPASKDALETDRTRDMEKETAANYHGNYTDQSAYPNDSSSPDLQMSQNADQYILTMELPGARKEDINVTEDMGVLTVYGSRTETPQNRPGYFNRTATLPRDAKLDKISAEFRDGVLTIKIDKKKADHPRKINVGWL